MKSKAFVVSALSCLLLGVSLPARTQVSFTVSNFYTGTGTVMAGDFNGDGKVDLLTSDGTMNLGNGNGSFRAGTKAPVPTVPLGYFVMAVADFTGDGKPDLLEEDLDTKSLLLFLGNGDATFRTTPISTTIGVALTSAFGVDLNGDGRGDVVGTSDSTLLVYLSNGNGTFASSVFSYNIGYPYPLLSLGDFNGDHTTDIVLSVPGQEVVLLGNGKGTFQSAKTSVGPSSASDVTVADFNGDGKLDLALGGAVLLGNGDGTFQAPLNAGAGGTAGDFNGDGKLDLVSGAQVYLGNGDGTFSTFGHPYLVESYSNTAVADFNGDGKLDMAVGNTVLLGNGNGTFQGNPSSVGTVDAVEEWDAVAGDLDNNGTIDVAVAVLNHVTVLMNDGTGQLSVTQTYTLQEGYDDTIVTGDFNADGNLDLIVAAFQRNGGDVPTLSYSVLLGNGNGTFQVAFYPIGNAGGPGRPLPVVGDFNNDGKLDFAESHSNSVFLGNGDGTFAAPIHIGANYPAGYFVSADFNSDQKLDIAGLCAFSDGTALLFGNGDGSFQDPVCPPNLQSFYPQFTADLNHDGKPDLISDSYSEIVSQVALGNGDGTFASLPSFSQYVVAIADLNGDGRPDAVYQAASDNNMLQTGIMLGNGDGTFGSPRSVFATSDYRKVLVADMTGDGLGDLVFVPGVGVLINTTSKAVPDFTIGAGSGSSTSQVVNAGQTAAFDLIISSLGTFSGTVNLSCAITPTATSATTCALSSASLQIGNGTAQPVTVSVSTVAPVITSAVPYVLLPPESMRLFWTTMLLASSFLWIRTRKRLPVLVAPMVVLMLVSIVSCAGSGSPTSHVTGGTPSGTYTATITATSGGLNHSVALTVVVR